MLFTNHPLSLLLGGARRARSRVKSYSRGLSLDQLYMFQGLAYVLALLPAAFAPLRTAVLLYGSLAEPAEDQHAHTLGLLSTGFLLIACIFFALEVWGGSGFEMGMCIAL